jgi:hypothetical protein
MISFNQEDKTMPYRIECSPEQGILLWIDAPCGIKQPLMRWGSLEEVKTFGESILSFYNNRKMMLDESDRKKSEEESSVADKLLRQAFGDDNECFDQT